MNRKNKTNQTVVWPTTPYFTIKDLLSLNPSFIEITLRVRLAKAKDEDGKVAEIGFIHGGKRRPRKVFAMTPVTQMCLDKAQQDGIQLVENARKLVNVLNVTTPSKAVPSPTHASV
jgi:hypothetical protein